MRSMNILLILAMMVAGCETKRNPNQNSKSLDSNIESKSAIEKTQLPTTMPRNMNFGSEDWKRYFASLTPLASSEEALDYFPSAPGTEWVYEIIDRTSKPYAPLSVDQITWPMGEQFCRITGRGLLFSRTQESGPYTLAIRVAGIAARQGRLQFPKAIVLKIIRDDLGIFRDAREIFWAFIPDDKMHSVQQIITYLPNASGAPGHQREDGYLYRMAFFVGKPGIAQSASPPEQPAETVVERLLFLGMDTAPAEAGGQPCLHFLRIVDANSDFSDHEPSYLDKGFVEELWYAKDRGLVRLEQRIDGEISMIWALAKYIKI